MLSLMHMLHNMLFVQQLFPAWMWYKWLVSAELEFGGSGFKLKFYCYCLAKPTLPKNYEKETWKKLEEAVSAIHR